MNPHDGGPAFARPSQSLEDRAQTGMSLRDYFAGQWVLGASQYWANTAPAKLATTAYEMADAMLAEREKHTKAPV